MFYSEKNTKIGNGKSGNYLHSNHYSIAKKKWFILFTCRSPNFSKTEFFEKISVTVNKASNKYDNLLFAGDLNINTLRPTSDSFNHLSEHF